jgi:hypothetical protein
MAGAEACYVCNWNLNTAGGPVENERVAQHDVEGFSNVTSKWRNRSSE